MREQSSPRGKYHGIAWYHGLASPLGINKKKSIYFRFADLSGPAKEASHLDKWRAWPCEHHVFASFACSRIDIHLVEPQSCGHSTAVIPNCCCPWPMREVLLFFSEILRSSCEVDRRPGSDHTIVVGNDGTWLLRALLDGSVYRSIKSDEDSMVHWFVMRFVTFFNSLDKNQIQASRILNRKMSKQGKTLVLLRVDRMSFLLFSVLVLTPAYRSLWYITGLSFVMMSR